MMVEVVELAGLNKPNLFKKKGPSGDRTHDKKAKWNNRLCRFESCLRPTTKGGDKLID